MSEMNLFQWALTGFISLCGLCVLGVAIKVILYGGSDGIIHVGGILPRKKDGGGG